MKSFSIASEFVNVAAERAVLSGIKNDPNLYWQLLDYFADGTFVAEKSFYSAIKNAIEAGSALPDIPTDWSLNSSLDNPEEVARYLSDLHQRRLLSILHEEAAKRIFDLSEPALDTIKQIEDDLNGVQSAIRVLETAKLTNAFDLLPSLLSDVKEKRKKRLDTGKPVTGISTGLTAVDNILGGLNPGLCIVSGPPGAGKTTASLQIAIHAATQVPVLYITYENSVLNLLQKGLCQEASISSSEVDKGNIEPVKLEQAAQRIQVVLKNLYLITGSSKTSLDYVRAKALQIMSRRNSSRCLIVFDYLQRACRTESYEYLRQSISTFAGELRDLSNRLQSPIIAISSMNRSGYANGKSAEMASLKESGDIEYSADAILLLERDKSRETPTSPMSSKRMMKLSIAKNRHGSTGEVDLVFHSDTGVMREENRYV